MKRILIIGGCGYIGSSLFQFLKSQHYAVDTVDLEWFGNTINPKNIKTNYRHLTKKALDTYHIIILLAGFSSVKMTAGRMKAAFKNDVENFIHLLGEITTQKFIYASSSSIYGNTRRMHVTEDYDKYSPTNYYDLNKKIIDHYAALSTIDYYGLRLGTVCGYSPHLRTDLMINKMFDTAYRTGTITIHNPTMNRPILGLKDFSRAIKVIIEGKSNPGIYNLASFNATIGEVSDRVRQSLKNTKIIVEEAKSLYNFSVDTSKFESTYRFVFHDTVENIVKSLKRTYHRTHKTVRE